MTPQFVSAKNFFENQSKPVSICQNIWFENTTTLLHSPRFLVDKTQIAVAIANEVANSGREVLYISTEPSFGNNQADADKLFIFTPQFDGIDDKRDYADLVFEAIEHAIRTTEIRTFVIDSVTRIAALSFGRNASAAYVMKRLVALQVKCRLSLLVLADDTTKSSNRALFSLATSEIALNPQFDETAELVDLPQPTQPKHIPNTPFPICRPAPDVPLTRQQRRAFERQNNRIQ